MSSFQPKNYKELFVIYLDTPNDDELDEDVPVSASADELDGDAPTSAPASASVPVVSQPT
ncbi:hypothetical protein AGMMS49556_04910 [Endomicrobiia bacterium]|nr:hypothetical protein AGMMS49556_04910 [Endomicrobiia bacterium]